jgi:hypothetical protein
LMSDELASIQPGDAIFWLGSPEAGAIYFTALRTRYPDVPFFLGPQAASPIFSERTQITDPIYLLFWLDDGYEQWRARYGSQSPTAYVTYRATQQAIAMSLGQAWPPSHAWRVEMVNVAMDGAW